MINRWAKSCLHSTSSTKTRCAKPSEAAGYQPFNLSGLVANAAALALIPKAIAIKHTLFPVSFDPQASTLVLVSANPDDILARDAIAYFVSGRPN